MRFLVLHFVYFFQRKKVAFSSADVQQRSRRSADTNGTVLLKFLPSVGFLGKVLDSNHLVSVEKEGKREPTVSTPASSISVMLGIDFLQGQFLASEEVGRAALLSLFPSFSIWHRMSLSACCQHEFRLFENSVSFERSLVKNHLK